LDQEFFFRKLFRPKTLAFIGATSFRHWHVNAYIQRFPKENLYLVAKYDDEINGHKCYRNIDDIPDEIDHAVISINRKNLLDVIYKCVEKKIYTIHIFSAGTGEFDEQGLEIEDELFRIFNQDGVKSRLIGPNCMGMYTPRGKYSYQSDFSETPGEFSVVSQSGDLTSRMVRTLNSRGVYFDNVASVGNSVSLKAADFIDYYNQDKNTEVILCYLEGFSRYRKLDGRTFFDALKRNKKPLLLLKGGISEQGSRTANSHTGSLASNRNIWDSIFKQTSAIPIDNFDELMDTAVLFKHCKHIKPKNDSLLLSTYSGGSAVLAVDGISRLGVGIKIPPIQEPALSEMKALIKVGSINNPLDLPGVRDPAIRTEIMNVAMKEPYISGVIQLTSGPRIRDKDADNTKAIDEYYANIKERKDLCDKLGKPFMVYSTSTPVFNEYTKMFHEKLSEFGIPIFSSFERGAKAFHNLYLFHNKKIE
jgi:acyl-CoA synthetase (NDP forming)